MLLINISLYQQESAPPQRIGWENTLGCDGMFTSIKSALLILVLALALQGCGTAPVANPPQEFSTSTPTPPPPPEKITITAVGDFLMHMPVVQSAQLPDGTYNFKPIFSEVADLLAGADLTIANLETRLAGKAYGYSGYPVFNCPEALAHDMKDLGIDVVTTANNHSMDRGWPGIVNTLDHLRAVGLQPIGTYQNEEASQQVFTTTIKGIKIGILNYAENTNGIPLPNGKEFAVDLMNTPKIYQDIAKLKSQGAEVLVACLHFGTEYQRQPNDFQKKLVDDLLQQGVDVIFGNHVHVIQPMDLKKITTSQGEKEAFVIYSLGNFVSNQSWRYSNCGLMANVELEKVDGQVKVSKADYIPVWVDTYLKNGQKEYRVLPVQRALETYQDKSDPYLTAEDYTKLKEVWQDTTSLISEACPVISPRDLSAGSKI